MKLENTYLNEAKFRALYVGQTVLSHPGNDVLYTLPSDLIFGERDRFLSLRSIESLTDGELIDICRRTGVYNHGDEVAINDGKWIANGVTQTSPFFTVNYPFVADYLRSISILIPWMDLSVEDIIAYGWAVINQTTN